MRKPASSPKPKASPVQSVGRCVCGAVRLEIDVPAVWAWHDHSPASRHAQGAAYATYVGSWRSRFRILQGEGQIRRYEDPELGTARSFCGTCGTPLFYERARSPKMVNIPRALFAERTGREPRYHSGVAHMADWTWRGEAMSPLKAYPGVMFVRPRKAPRRKPTDDSLFEP